MGTEVAKNIFCPPPGRIGLDLIPYNLVGGIQGKTAFAASAPANHQGNPCFIFQNQPLFLSVISLIFQTGPRYRILQVLRNLKIFFLTIETA